MSGSASPPLTPTLSRIEIIVTWTLVLQILAILAASTFAALLIISTVKR